jgi:hypothetical protein
MAGRRVADFENSIAWGVILSNTKGGPALSDGGNLWNNTVVTTAGGHANLAGTAAAVTVASISAGRLAMRQQKSLDGIPLNVPGIGASLRLGLRLRLRRPALRHRPALPHGWPVAQGCGRFRLRRHRLARLLPQRRRVKLALALAGLRGASFRGR